MDQVATATVVDHPNGSAYEEVTSLPFQNYNYGTEAGVPISIQEQDINGGYQEEKNGVKEKPYPCFICGKRFSRRPHLTLHTRQHTGEKPYHCSHCGKQFADSSSLKSHIRLHTGQKPYACLICPKRFTQLSCLKTHIRIHAGGKTYTCNLCGEMFGRTYSLKVHVTNKHPGNEDKALADELKNTGMKNQAANNINGENGVSKEQILPSELNQNIQELANTVIPEIGVIPQNGISYQNNILFQKAVEESTLGPIADASRIIAEKFQQGGFSLQQCETCGKQVRNLKNHLKTHVEKTIPCEICGKLFGTKFLLHHHLDSHGEQGPGEGLKRFKCKLCDRSFYQRNGLIKHIRTHTGEKPYSCKYCDYRCSEISSLTTHTRTHTGERPYKCNTCGKCFAHSNILKDHTRIHTGERPYSCKICNKSFKQSSSLRSHKVTHSDVKPFKCPTCAHSSRTKHDLRRHSKIHIERPRTHKCTKCEKAFHSEYLARRHLEEVHERVRIVCPVCKQRFGNEKNLADHIKKYEGRKPFNCGHCGKYFHQKQQARKHILSHSEAKEISFHCRICDMMFISATSRDEHEAVFADSSPFKCEVCGKNFHIETCARKHVSTHTQKEIEDAELSGTIFSDPPTEYSEDGSLNNKSESGDSQDKINKSTCIVVVEQNNDSTV